MEELGYPSRLEQVAVRFERVRQSRQDIFLGEHNGEVVGMICYFSKPSLGGDGNFGQITDLVVKSQFRGIGFGRELVKFVENRARALGHTGIQLTTRLHRKEAHHFYQELGYEETSKKFVKRFV